MPRRNSNTKAASFYVWITPQFYLINVRMPNVFQKVNDASQKENKNRFGIPIYWKFIDYAYSFYAKN